MLQERLGSIVLPDIEHLTKGNNRGYLAKKSND